MINMSIKKRISMMFAVVFIINFVGIFIFLLLILPRSVNAQISSMKETVNNTVYETIDELKTSNDFYESIDESKFTDSMYIYIEDIDSNIVYSYPDSSAFSRINEDSNLYVTATEKFLTTNKNGQQIYFIKAAITMKNNYSIEETSGFLGAYLWQILVFEAIVFTIAMVIIIISIKEIILNPLENLSKKIRGYKKNVFIEEENVEKDEFKSLSKDFETLTTQISEEQEKQTRIIASVSHDIKTPLTSIMGYAEQLKKDDIPPERKNKYVNTVYEKSIAIKKMIEGLDDYITYSDKSDESERTLVSVNQLISAVNAYYVDDLEREKCVFTIENKTNDAWVSVNKADMMRVFGNIINNSVKHRSSDELKISIEVTQGAYDVYFKISDNGEGVPSDQYVKIFEPLYTTDLSRSKSVSGLGLSICKDIVESHSGKIHAEKSDFETGLSIVIALPKVKRK